MKSFKQFRVEIKEHFEREVQEDFHYNNVFLEGDWVKNTTNGKYGKVIRRGPNYIIALAEDNKIFRSWVKDLEEYSVL
tara:strand:+ start:1525 stop:1758 length:234 start_codon:yes stop_codon:yes gene_type:complete